MGRQQAAILGTGSYLPERVLHNSDLEKMVETSDEWIVTRTGMRERRIAKEDEYTSDMGAEAARQALEAAAITPESVDLVMVATITPDYIFPSTACLIQAKLGMVNAAAFDIQAACTGYIYAISLAKAFIESGTYKTILIVASEKLSVITNYKDRNTCILFGDGASACVIGEATAGKGLLIRDACLGAGGNEAELIIQPAGGSRKPASLETVDQCLHTIHMDGKEVFKHAVRRMESASKECLVRCGLQEGEIDWLIPHQANIRIIEAMAKRFQVPTERVYLTVHKYGNTSASSVGIALDELLREGKVKEKENILLTGFGAGLTWGACLLTKGGLE